MPKNLDLNLSINTIQDLDDVRYSQKNLIIVLLYTVLKKITTNALPHRTQFIFDKPRPYFALRELDIVLKNHALRAQSTDYSLNC